MPGRAAQGESTCYGSCHDARHHACVGAGRAAHLQGRPGDARQLRDATNCRRISSIPSILVRQEPKTMRASSAVLLGPCPGRHAVVVIRLHLRKGRPLV